MLSFRMKNIVVMNALVLVGTLCADIVLPSFSMDERRKIFSTMAHFKESEAYPVILPHTITDLNIVAGSKETPKMHLWNRLDKTDTIFGSAMLEYVLVDPDLQLKTAQMRQAALKELVSQPDFLSVAQTFMKRIGSEQDALLMAWSYNNPLSKESHLLSSLVGSSSPLMVESARKGLNGVSYATSAVLMAATGIEWGYLLYNLFHPRRGIGFHGPTDYAILGLYLATHGFDYMWYYQGISFCNAHEEIGIAKQKMMMSISFILKASRELYSLVKDHPTLTHALKHFVDLEKVATSAPTLSQEVRELMRELATDTFKGESSSWSYMGRVHVAHNRFMDCKDEFIPLLKALGEIDMLLSIAQVISDCKDKQQQYCFTQFVTNAEDPCLEVTDAWNPVLETNERAAEKLVTETLHLSNDKDAVSNILLTGPHGSGKSSLMREVAYDVFLSQVFGVAPAKACRMTFFSSINTYFVVQDNMEKGESAFMAAKNRLDLIEQRILALKENKFGISFIDEPVKDTFEDNASQIIIKFGKAIGPVTEHIGILATHYTEPAIVLSQEENRFTNFHMQIEERTHGRFKRFFKLVLGEDKKWFEDSAQRDRYIAWLKTIA
jgi:DNA mismatch repair protein MutS